MDKKITFSFGRNWKAFLKSINDDKINKATESMTQLLEIGDMKGKSFLDIGCGSGIFSYAAYRLGARKIVSFDVDPFSVECCKFMYEKAGCPNNWIIGYESILNDQLKTKLPDKKYDIVYSWGVLHHTGSMWAAIKNAADFVDRDGLFCIALYNKVDRIGGSKNWETAKRIYNAVPGIVKLAIEFIYVIFYVFILYLIPRAIIDIIKLKNPLIRIREYFKMERGMSWYIDIRDWLGGYPYEYATVEEVFKFMKQNYPEFQLTNIKSTNGLSCNTFLFKNHAGK